MKIAIIDYGMGNLFSVQRACEGAGLSPVLAAAPEQLEGAAGIILPGVGAFAHAMDELKKRGLIQPLVESVRAGMPLFGVCLGLQLLMDESLEFGRHPGLGLIPGQVARLKGESEGVKLKVPQVGWNRAEAASSWQGTPLEGVEPGAYMYFVHSYRVAPRDPSVVLSTTRYGDEEFCSSIRVGNIFACQFHPERSGPVGLRVYANWAASLAAKVI